MNHDQVRIPIACRFVASDQWLTTYFDSTCKISEVKQYILAKVYNTSVPDNDDQPSRNRPVSPITFASARNSLDSNFEGSLQDDHIIDLDPHLFSEPTRQLRTVRQPLSQRVASPSSGVTGSAMEQRPIILPPHHYPMIAFSTGQLLEDDCSLAWYRLRPHELLELHPPGTIVRFPRDVMLEYIKPYLELDVRALRVIVNDKDMHAFGPTTCAAPDASSSSKNNKKPKDLASDCSSAAGSASPASQSTRKRRKTRLEWRDRYLVLRQGMLSLYKSRTDLTPVHTCSLAKLTTLRGQEEIVHTATAAPPSPYIVCAKFRADVSTPVFPESQPVTTPMAEHWNDPWSGATIPRETDGFLRGTRGSKEDIKQQRRSTVEGIQQSKVNAIPKEDLFEGKTPDGKGECLRYDINIGDDTQGTWLVLDTLDEFAHSNLLRILHRCSPDTINTTLIPKYLLPESSFSSPPSLFCLLPPQNALGLFSYRYPEWRIEVSRRAQQSGLGSVSDAMAWVLCGGPPLESSVSKIASLDLRRKISDLTTDGSSTVHEPFDFDVDDDAGDKDDCELEWDSWAEDLMRQALANSTNDIAVTVTQPVSIHPSYPDKRIRPIASSSTFSSVTLSEQSGRLPSDILPGANMGLLSVDSPALLTAPGVLPFQSTGTTTSTVSAGGVVRTRSLITVDGRRGRGVARAMEVLSEDGDDDGPFMGKRRTGRQKRSTREDNNQGAMASSAPAHCSMAVHAPTANTITSTVTVRESAGSPSPPPLQFRSSLRPFHAEGAPRAAVTSSTPVSASTSASALTSASTPTSPVLTAVAGAGAGAGNVSETASVMSGITTMTTSTTTTIQLLPRRSSASDEMMLLPEATQAGSPSPSQRRCDKTEKGKGKGKGKQPKSPSSRGKVSSTRR